MVLMGDEAGEDRPFPLNMVATDPGFVLRLDEYEKPGGEFLRVLTWFRQGYKVQAWDPVGFHA